MSSTPQDSNVRLYKRPRIRLLVALGIGLIGLALRVHMALTGPVEWDEPIYLQAALNYAQDIRSGSWDQLMNSNYNYEHPLFNKLAYAGLLALRKPAPGLNESTFQPGGDIQPSPYFTRMLSLRLVSVAFGSAAVFILSLINPLAGLFLAVQTYAVKYTSVIYLEALPMCLSLLSVYTFAKFQAAHSPEQPASRPRLGWLAASGILIGLAAASKYIYGVTGLAVLIYAVIQGRKNLPRLIQSLLIWGAFAAVFFVLGDPALWSHPLAHFYRSLTYSVHYSQSDPTVLRKDYPFWQPLAWLALSILQQPPQLTPFFTTSGNFLLAVDSLFLPFALLGWRRMSKAHPLFGWWLVVGLAFLLAWNTKWPQYILLILVPYCLSAACGVGLVVQFLNSAVLRWKSRLRTQ